MTSRVMACPAARVNSVHGDGVTPGITGDAARDEGQSRATVPNKPFAFCA